MGGLKVAVAVVLAFALGAAGTLVIVELVGSREPRAVPPIELEVERDDDPSPENSAEGRKGKARPEKMHRRATRGPAGSSGAPKNGGSGGAPPAPPPPPVPAGDDGSDDDDGGDDVDDDDASDGEDDDDGDD
jgi:hypothetical protein